MGRAFASASSQYISTDTPPVTAAAFSFACWTWHTTLGEQAYITLGDKDSFVDYFMLYCTSSQYGLSARDSGGNTVISYGSSLPTGTWVHVGGTITSATRRDLYVSGVNRGNSTVSRAPAGVDRLTLGANGRQGVWGKWAFLNGRLAEVYIWNVALSDAEMTQVYNGGIPQPSALVFASHLAEDSFASQIGAAMTNGGSTDAADHPTVRYRKPRRRYFLMGVANAA